MDLDQSVIVCTINALCTSHGGLLSLIVSCYYGFSFRLVEDLADKGCRDSVHDSNLQRFRIADSVGHPMQPLQKRLVVTSVGNLVEQKVRLLDPALEIIVIAH